MSTTRNTIIKQAQGWLGKKESDGSFKSIIDLYNTITPLPRGHKATYTDSWCAIFISALAKACDALDIIPAECSCGQMIELCKAKGIWQEDQNITPPNGAIIFYDWDKKDSWPDHVGLVESTSGRNVIVLEGNKNNAVERRTIKIGSNLIRGYALPKYSEETQPAPQPVPTPTPTPTPSNQISVDGEWGKNTTRKAQKVFGAVVDGIVSNQFSTYRSSNPGLLSQTFEWEDRPGKNGSLLIKKIQKHVGVKQDGYIGKNTIKAMQKWLGTPVDGVASKPSVMVKAFQKWLNTK